MDNKKVRIEKNKKNIKKHFCNNYIFFKKLINLIYGLVKLSKAKK